MTKEILNVEGLCKKYNNFYLDNVSFKLEQGFIMGFIGSNGAGKTTTLKGILNLIKPQKGNIEIFGKSLIGNEVSLKQDIAFMMGGSDYYLKRKLSLIGSVVQRFYNNWDQNCFEAYLKRFKLDKEKKVEELSQGMRIKFALALALSHNARLIILDEPTSGLDPVARDNLLELFQELVEDGTRSILFSTHITSDLEKCADFITYINNGKIISSSTKDDFIDSYRLINGSNDNLDEYIPHMISYKINSFGFQGLIKNENISNNGEINSQPPTLDDIMIFHAKGEENNE